MQPLQGQSPAEVAALDCLGNTHLQPPHQLLDCFPINLLPVLGVGERRISSGRSCHLLFFLRDGSAHSLARRDQTDVGISAALHTGVGFFGPLNAAALDPPCGEVCPVRTGRASQRFHVLQQSSVNDLGPLFTPAELCSRRAIAESLALSACLLAQACQSLWLVHFDDACERSFGFDHVIRF
jgi:hypothetical protein